MIGIENLIKKLNIKPIAKQTEQVHIKASEQVQIIMKLSKIMENFRPIYIWDSWAESVEEALKFAMEN